MIKPLTTEDIERLKEIVNELEQSNQPLPPPTEKYCINMHGEAPDDWDMSRLRLNTPAKLHCDEYEKEEKQLEARSR